MIEIYWFIVKMLWYSTASITFILILSQTIYSVWCWLDDKKSYKPVLMDHFAPGKKILDIMISYSSKYDISDFAIVVFLVFVILFICSFLWPLVIVATTIIGMMHVLRGAIRFKKEIKTAIRMKADKGHVH